MSKLTQAFAQLRALNRSVPIPRRLPSKEEVAAAESATEITFPEQFRQYLLEVSDVNVGDKEPVILGRPNAHTDFASVLESARAMGVAEELIPICEDNGSYYCVEASGRVVFWDQASSSDESWPSVADWILAVWIGEM